ncbi:hypothetical protein ACQP1W_42645 [Spirillospora sp. CA-255316]
MSHRSVTAAVTAAGTALLAAAAPPAAALVLPDLSPGVADAARAGLGGGPGFVRAAGLTLPALLLSVPPGAWLARRHSPRAVLVAGLCVLVAGLAGARYADSVPLVAVARGAQGAGAGLALPATLVLVWERGGRFLAALWAGALAAGLLVAMPLALHATPALGSALEFSAESAAEPAAGADWRSVLVPVPWPAALAAGAAVIVCLVGRHRASLPAPRHAERAQLVLPVAPAAGLSFLAVVAARDWSPGARLVVACIALVALFGLATAAGRDAAAGSPLGCAVVMVTTGLLVYPLAGPLAGLAQAAGTVPLPPFAAGGAAALAGALLTVRLGGRAARAAVPAGHGLIVAAVAVALAVPAPGDPRLLAAVLVPLGLGAGLALAASLRDAGAGAALFGLGLCFPAVLTGQLLVLSLQAGRWHHAPPETAAQRLAVLTDGYRTWLVSAGVIAVLLALAARRRRGGGGAVPEPGAG